MRRIDTSIRRRRETKEFSPKSPRNCFRATSPTSVYSSDNQSFDPLIERKQNIRRRIRGTVDKEKILGSEHNLSLACIEEGAYKASMREGSFNEEKYAEVYKQGITEFVKHIRLHSKKELENEMEWLGQQKESKDPNFLEMIKDTIHTEAKKAAITEHGEDKSIYQRIHNKGMRTLIKGMQKERIQETRTSLHQLFNVYRLTGSHNDSDLQKVDLCAEQVAKSRGVFDEKAYEQFYREAVGGLLRDDFSKTRLSDDNIGLLQTAIKARLDNSQIFRETFPEIHDNILQEVHDMATSVASHRVEEFNKSSSDARRKDPIQFRKECLREYETAYTQTYSSGIQTIALKGKNAFHNWIWDNGVKK